MPFYINPRDGTLAYDATIPDGAIPTNDPNTSGVKLAPADSWYALGNNSRVYVKAGVPIPTAQNGKLATSYIATDDAGTPPQGDGTIHPTTETGVFKLPGRGQFENQAWTGPSDWRGIPYAQYDTSGQPLSRYFNAVDQLQALNQWKPAGQQFGRFQFGGGLLGQQTPVAQNQQQGGLLSAPRVTTDSTSAGGYWSNPQGITPTPAAPAGGTPPQPTMGQGPAYTGGTGWGLGNGPGSAWATLDAQGTWGPSKQYANDNLTWIGGLPYISDPANSLRPDGLRVLQFWGSGQMPGANTAK